MSDNIKKHTNTTEENVKKSVSTIYFELLNKRRIKKEFEENRKRIEKENKKKLKEESKKEDNLTKKEKREAQLNSWKEIIIGLTGDDLEYVSTKKNKKKYKKWIDDDNNTNNISVDKPIKKKKKNFKKEFEPELNMLKAIVTEQNKFTADLQKRYQNTAGPNTRDAMPLNKTLVELASVINNSRSNSLGLLREIGNIKKTIADLYMKQYKIDNDGSGGDSIGQDLGIMGSSLASSLFGNKSPSYSSDVNNTVSSTNSNTVNNNSTMQNISDDQVGQKNNIIKFDPSSWDGNGIDIGNAKYEAIPHTIVVEFHKNENKARFKAIRDDNGEELKGCPVPTCTIKSMDMNNKVAKDDFDQVYKLEIV